MMLGPEDFEECEKTGLARYECAHCQGHKLGDETDVVQYGNLDPSADPDLPYEIVGRAFESQYRGHCAIDYEHPIKRGDKIARVQRSDNPMIVIGGYACKNCIRELPRAR